MLAVPEFYPKESVLFTTPDQSYRLWELNKIKQIFEYLYIKDFGSFTQINYFTQVECYT